MKVYVYDDEKLILMSEDCDFNQYLSKGDKLVRVLANRESVKIMMYSMVEGE